MNRFRQKGFSLIAAIFLVTVLASLAAFLVVMTGVSQQTPVLGLNGAQAYHAARSGLEWGISRAINDDTPADCGAPAVFTLHGYQVTVTCTTSSHSGDNYYVINSTASTGTPGSMNFAVRRLRATVTPSAP